MEQTKLFNTPLAEEEHIEDNVVLSPINKSKPYYIISLVSKNPKQNPKDWLCIDVLIQSNVSKDWLKNSKEVVDNFNNQLEQFGWAARIAQSPIQDFYNIANSSKFHHEVVVDKTGKLVSTKLDELAKITNLCENNLIWDSFINLDEKLTLDKNLKEEKEQEQTTLFEM